MPELAIKLYIAAAVYVLVIVVVIRSNYTIKGVQLVVAAGKHTYPRMRDKHGCRELPGVD